MPVDDLRAPELAELWQAVRRRLARGGRPVAVRVTLATPAERRAVAVLLGLDRSPGATAVVRLERLEAVLAARGTSLAAALTMVDAEPASPLGSLDEATTPARPHLDEVTSQTRARPEEATSSARARREELWRWLAEHPVVRRTPGLDAWAARVRRSGLVGNSVDRTRELLERALAVLDRLPAAREPRSALAGRVLGDPYALDDGSRLAAVVLRAVAALTGLDAASQGGTAALWSRVGVVCDPLAATVLVAGPWWADAAGPALGLTSLAHSGGRPVCLTADQMTASGALHPVGGWVWTVENPATLRAVADTMGTDIPPMACASGWPTSAGLRLFQGVARGGGRVIYHGDFDPEGLRIADFLVSTCAAWPWRMTKADYLAGILAAPSITSQPADGTGPQAMDVSDLPDVMWAPGLVDRMRTSGVPVYEDQVLAALMQDLQLAADQIRSHG